MLKNNDYCGVFIREHPLFLGDGTMYIYGLDLSLSCTGVTIIERETLEVVYIGHIEPKGKSIDSLAKEYKNNVKLLYHYQAINRLIEKYPPCEVAIERGFSRHNTTTQVLFRVHGVYNLAFANQPQVYYTPVAVKKAVYDATANKEEISEVLSRRFKRKFKNMDESDSLAVAVCHMIECYDYPWKNVKALTAKKLIQREKEINKKEKERLKKIKDKEKD